MNSDNGFLSKIIQFAGLIFTVGGLISQYLLRDEFRRILSISEENSYYQAFTIAGLILGIVIFIAVFASRYLLLNRWYLNSKSYDRYLQSIRNVQNQQIAQNIEPATNITQEPFYLDGRRIAYIVLLLSLVLFILVFYFSDTLLKSIFYLLFLLSVIYSATTFIILLYLEEDWKQKEKEARENLLNRIATHISPQFKTIERLEDTSNLLYPVTKMIIEIGKIKLLVVADKNNPDKYFSIQPFVSNQQQGKSNASKK